MTGIVVLVLSSSNPGDNETNARRWSGWVAGHMRGGFLLYHAVVNRGINPASCAFQLISNTGGAGEDVELNQVCVVAHGGDAGHFLDDLGRDSALSVAHAVRDFIAGKNLAHAVTMRVQVCNAGRYPLDETFHAGVTPAGRVSTSPNRSSVLWPGGKFLDLGVAGNPSTVIGEARGLIMGGSLVNDFTMIRRYVPFAAVSGLMVWSEDDERWKFRAANALPGCNAAALTDNAFTRPPLRAFLQRVAESRRAGRNNYVLADVQAFNAVPEAQRFMLVQYATGGDTATVGP